jgi:hypothetical protein
VIASPTATASDRQCRSGEGEEFFAKNAAEFQKRDCVLHTVAGFETREQANG